MSERENPEVDICTGRNAAAEMEFSATTVHPDSLFSHSLLLVPENDVICKFSNNAIYCQMEERRRSGKNCTSLTPPPCLDLC